jgi:hypothetical protein
VSEQIANMPLLNLLSVFIVGFAYFIGVAVYSYKRGGALTLWSFGIGAGALVLLNAFRDKVVEFFNFGISFVVIFFGGSAAVEGELDSSADSAGPIIQCTASNQTTCNESGFLFLLWLTIVIVAHIVIYCVYKCFFKKQFSSKPTLWAFFVGLANAWLYGFILLPPICALFGVELGVDPFTTDLVDALVEFYETVLALVNTLFGGLWTILKLEPWMLFLVVIIGVLIAAARSLGKSKKGGNGKGGGGEGGD